MTERGISIGVKVLVALASGVAVFVGINACSNCNRDNNTKESDKRNFGRQLSDGLHRTQEFSGKVSALLNLFTQMTDTTRSLFNNDDYCQDENYYQRSSTMTRINPVITQCGTGGYFNNNCEESYPTFNKKKF